MPAKIDLVNKVKELGGDPTGVNSKNLLNRMIKELESKPAPTPPVVEEDD